MTSFDRYNIDEKFTLTKHTLRYFKTVINQSKLKVLRIICLYKKQQRRFLVNIGL